MIVTTKRKYTKQAVKIAYEHDVWYRPILEDLIQGKLALLAVSRIRRGAAVFSAKILQNRAGFIQHGSRLVRPI